jgi:hypothetical protein
MDRAGCKGMLAGYGMWDITADHSRQYGRNQAAMGPWEIKTIRDDRTYYRVTDRHGAGIAGRCTV